MTEQDPGGIRLLREAMQRLTDLVEEATHRGVQEAASAALATADRSGRPSVRTVYLASLEPEGLVFFADTESGKGQQLRQNPRAAVCLFWPQLQQQATVEGEVEMLSENDSEDIWRKRPRESRLAAWAMDIGAAAPGARPSRERLQQVKERYSFEQVPRPPRWRAYFVRPDRMEFWETGWHRLRPRVRYFKQGDAGWCEQVETL